MTLFCIMAVLLSGCATRYVAVYPDLPVLDCPDRPELVCLSKDEFINVSDEAFANLESVIDNLLLYSMKLETVLDEYNKFAEKENENNLNKVREKWLER